MWKSLVDFFGRIFSALLERWVIRTQAERDARVETRAEVADADRERANQIRDRVDGARLGGGVQPGDTADQRGYRD